MRKFVLVTLCMLFASAHILAQTKLITGKVTDDKDQPLESASVVVKGTQVGTVTTKDGSFMLNVPSAARTLLVSYLGMIDKEINITNKSSYTISLSATSKNDMQEVIVIGYGTQKKASVSSSLSSIKSQDLENKPFTSVDQMLAGKVAGLIAPSFSGQPGAAQSIRIRGISSVSAGNNPLYVVDGVIVNSGDNSRLATTSNTLAGINTNDIEDVTILKDAQATALYGSRAANGVILITTKSGRAGKTKIRFDTEVGYTNYADLPENGRFTNADEWLTLTEEGLKNAGFSQASIDATMINYGKGTGVNTDWRKLVTRTGKQRQYNLSASGGEGKTTFFLSAGFFNQEASVIASDFKRYSATANIKHSSGRLTIGVNLSGSNSIQHTPSNGGLFANPVGGTAFLIPTQNPYNPDGSLNINRTGPAWNQFSNDFNPLYIAANDQHNLNNTQIRGNINTEYSILKGLKISNRFGVDVNFINEFIYQNPFHGDGRTVNGRGSASDTRLFNWINTTLLSYSGFLDRQSDIRIDAMVGHEAQKSKGLFLDAAATAYPPTTQLPFSTNAATVTNGKESASDYDFEAILSTGTLTYLNKYVLNASYRRDGSSRFSEKNRWGNFWSVGAAWNVDREKFFEPLQRYINSFKMRGSYGTTGNANIANYGWRQTFGYGANYNGLPGGTFNSIGNDILTWETNKQFDIGADIAVFKSRLTFTFDIYKRESSNLLFADPVSPTTGFNSVTRNIGTMQNKGYEISMNATPVKQKDFNWSLSFNISSNKNKIVKLPGGKDIIDGTFILKEGFDYRTYYGRVYVGVDPANGDPLWYKDSSHKSTVNDRNLALREPLKGMSASPKFTGGFTNTISYKGMSLSVDFIYNFGNYVTDGWAFYLVDGTQPFNGKYALNLKRWQKPGDITDVPKYVYGSTNSSSSFSSRFLQKGDYIRLRNVTAGYSFSNPMLNSMHIGSVVSSLNFYMRLTNFWTKTYDKNLTIDPEAGANSTSNLEIYYTKTVTFGLVIGF